MLRFRVRPAALADLARCLEIDASYVTTYVWQVQEGFDEPDEEDPAGRANPKIRGKSATAAPPAFRLELVPSRLPHPLAIAASLGEQQLLAEWKRTDLLLVAEMIEPDPPPPDPVLEEEKAVPLPPGPPVGPDLLGYIGITVDGLRHVAWVSTLAVQIDFRRKGIGGALLGEAREWADRNRLRSLLVELQTKNYPAISFFQKNGFFFSGYNNAYYSTREIALFFGKRLEKFS